MSENTINIALAADDNYAVCMGITILSVLKSASKEDKLAFYILENQISAKRKAEIDSLKKFREFDIFWIPLNPSDFKQCKVTQRGLTLTTYARFLISDTIPCSKVLYLDCDILGCDIEITFIIGDLWSYKKCIAFSCFVKIGAGIYIMCTFRLAAEDSTFGEVGGDVIQIIVLKGIKTFRCLYHRRAGMKNKPTLRIFLVDLHCAGALRPAAGRKAQGARAGKAQQVGQSFCVFHILCLLLAGRKISGFLALGNNPACFLCVLFHGDLFQLHHGAVPEFRFGGVVVAFLCVAVHSFHEHIVIVAWQNIA